MLDNIKMTKNKGLEYLSGQMDGNTRDNGKMVNNKEWAYILIPKDNKNTLFGKKVKR